MSKWTLFSLYVILNSPPQETEWKGQMMTVVYRKMYFVYSTKKSWMAAPVFFLQNLIFYTIFNERLNYFCSYMTLTSHHSYHNFGPFLLPCLLTPFFGGEYLGATTSNFQKMVVKKTYEKNYSFNSETELVKG